MSRAHWAGWVMRWHRRIGIVACVGVLMWGLSGVMHPIMSRLNPKPVQFAPPPQVLDFPHDAQHISLQAALNQAAIEQIEAVRVLKIHEQGYYQITVSHDGVRRYLPTSKNVPDLGADADADYAVQLARYYLNDSQSVVKARRLVTEFDDDYVYINRLLPVWRIDFERPDGMRVYIDTGTSRLGAMVDHRKAVLAKIFRILHSHTYLAGHERGRLLVMGTFLLLAGVSALGGLVLYGLRWGSFSRKQGLRKWHRRLGLTVSVLLLLSIFSGAWHMLSDNAESDIVPPVAALEIPRERLQICPLTVLHEQPFAASDMGLLASEGQLFYRFTPAKASAQASAHDEHQHGKPAMPAPVAATLLVKADRAIDPAATQQPADISEAQLMAQLARQALPPALQQAHIVAQRPVFQFGEGYGFVFKRLPVVKVSFDTPEHHAVYVEPATGIVAAVVDDAARTQGWIFAYLHKWDALAPWLGKEGRDLLLGLYSLANVVLACLGIWLFVRTGQRRSAAAR